MTTATTRRPVAPAVRIARVAILIALSAVGLTERLPAWGEGVLSRTEIAAKPAPAPAAAPPAEPVVDEPLVRKAVDTAPALTPEMQALMDQWGTDD